jgi:hypothetical protein
VWQRVRLRRLICFDGCGGEFAQADFFTLVVVAESPRRRTFYFGGCGGESAQADFFTLVVVAESPRRRTFLLWWLWRKVRAGGLFCFGGCGGESAWADFLRLVWQRVRLRGLFCFVVVAESPHRRTLIF